MRNWEFREKGGKAQTTFLVSWKHCPLPPTPKHPVHRSQRREPRTLCSVSSVPARSFEHRLVASAAPICRADRTETGGRWCGSTAFPITQVDFAETSHPIKATLLLLLVPFPGLTFLPYPPVFAQFSLAALSSRFLSPRATQTQATQGCLRKFGTVTLTVYRGPHPFLLGKE